MTTPVTVTRPIRGSFSSGSASARTCRTDSFTRRIRSLMGHIQASARARPRGCRRLVLPRGARRGPPRARSRQHPAARSSCSSARTRRPRRARTSPFPGSPRLPASIAHIRAGRVDWRLVAWMLPPSVAGAVAGGYAAGSPGERAADRDRRRRSSLFGIDLLRPRRALGSRAGAEPDIRAAVLAGAVIGVARRADRPHPRHAPRARAHPLGRRGAGARGRHESRRRDRGRRGRARRPPAGRRRLDAARGRRARPRSRARSSARATPAGSRRPRCYGRSA